MKTVTVFSYYDTENLGDAIQSIALTRLLGAMEIGHQFRDRDSVPGELAGDDVLLANGYLDGRWKPGTASKYLFAGVYARDAGIMARIAELAHGEIGARDPYTAKLAKEGGVPCALIGCATLTLDRYDGPRNGVIRVDAGPGNHLKQYLPKGTSWESQWWRATERLLLLQRAELVITSRLHIALPCLAFGTPVVIPESVPETVHEPERLSLLDALGFQYSCPQVLDVRPWAARYRRFVETFLA